MLEINLHAALFQVRHLCGTGQWASTKRNQCINLHEPPWIYRKKE
jgi:hypothetical protein